MPRDVAEEAGRRVAQHLAAAPEYRRCRRLVAYAATPDELPLTVLLARARADGKRTLLPRMLDASVMVLANAEHVEQLEPGRYGVREPPRDAPVESLGPDVLVLVPGLAFDERGGRLGRGRGVWDRALEARCDAVVFGVGYELQIIAAVPREAHDQMLDALVTEAGIRRFSRA